MKVSSEYKMEILDALLPALFDSLADGAPGGEATADDVVDLFTMGLAAILDNDSHLKTPRDFRIWSERIAKRTETWAREFRVVQEKTGVSWLRTALGSRVGQTQATVIN